MAQVYGVELPIMSPLLFIFTVLAAPLGEPVIPRVRVIILKIVLQGAWILVNAIIIMIGIDYILGIIRTAVNVMDDLTVFIVFYEFYRIKWTTKKFYVRWSLKLLSSNDIIIFILPNYSFVLFSLIVFLFISNSLLSIFGFPVGFVGKVCFFFILNFLLSCIAPIIFVF